MLCTRTDWGYHTRRVTFAESEPDVAITTTWEAPREFDGLKKNMQPEAVEETLRTLGSEAVQPAATGASAGDERGVPNTLSTDTPPLSVLPVMGALLNHSEACCEGYAYMPTSAGATINSWPAVFQPDRESNIWRAPLLKNVMVPWFTREPTVPLNARDDSPAGALARTVNVSVSADVTVPVTKAAAVVPLIPVAATLTKPVDTPSAGELNSGADAEPGT